MKLRHKQHGYEASASDFNTHGLGEVIAYFGDGSADTMPVSEFDVFLEATGEWKDMRQAFQDHDVINDNYNTHFFEPRTQEDRERGYTL